MRDVEVIDQELRLLAVVRTAVCREGARLSTDVIDELLDERNAVALNVPLR